MTNAKRSKTPHDAAKPVPDADMDKLVTEAEKQLTQGGDAQLVDLIDASTRGVLTLFPHTPRNVETGKTYPVMLGHLDTRRVKIPVSAFMKQTDEGRAFLSLSIGPQGQDHIGGAVFREEEQNQLDGMWARTPGKEDERHGVIAKTMPVEGTNEYETVFALRFFGKRRLSAAGVPYIKAQVYPKRKSEATQQAMAGCF